MHTGLAQNSAVSRAMKLVPGPSKLYIHEQFTALIFCKKHSRDSKQMGAAKPDTVTGGWLT